MKKFIYSKKGKFITIAVQLIAAVVMVVSFCSVFLFTTITIPNSFGDFKYTIDFFNTDTEYEDSDYFHTMLSNQVSEMIRYAVIRNQMETDGVFNGKKVIDIEEYAKRYESVKKNYISAPYYLEDLIKWGQYGIEYVNEEQQSVNDSAKANTIYSYEYEMEEAGDALVPMNATLTLESAEIVDYYTADGWKLVERYKTIDQLGLGAYVDKNHTYDQLCQYLEQAAKSLTYNYSQYKKYNQVFQDNMTNLSYYIALQNDDGTKTVYTNIEVGSLEEAIGYIRDMGRYIYYDATSLTYDTNTNLSEENLIQEISNYDYTYAGNSQIVIGIDTNYLYQDSFLEGYSNYTKIIPQIPMFILLCIISFLVLVVFFFISCYTVGKSDKDSKEVRLVLSDHIYTEVFFLFGIAFIVGLGALIFLILQELYNYQISNRAICISAGVGTFLLYSLLISFLLGVLRRVKAKQLWKNSMLRAICILLKKGILAGTGFIKKQINECKDNGSLIVNVWVPYLCFIGLQLLFIPFGIPGLCILMIIDILIGVYQYKTARTRMSIINGMNVIQTDDTVFSVESEGLHGENKKLAEAVNSLGEGIRVAVETSMKDEKLKADLITNVSHDIKTPLTSIINYVDLIKRENIENEKVNGYIAILDTKSQRLKHLTEDLVEASKISSGNITLQLEKINFVELINQSIGEFYEKFENYGLHLVTNLPSQPIFIEADSRRIWRVIENLGNNVSKYAMKNTRVYIDVRISEREKKDYVLFSIKNISEQPLNIDASELTERFIRGDVSRSTEGSGLGLSIAKNLVELQHGHFQIYLDGDLFKATIEFPIVK